MANVNNENVIQSSQKYRGVFGFLKNIIGDTFGSMFFGEEVDDQLVSKFEKNVDELENAEIKKNKKKTVRDMRLRDEEIIKYSKAIENVSAKDAKTQQETSKDRSE